MPGVHLTVIGEDWLKGGRLVWAEIQRPSDEVYDGHRLTEDGAEGIALAVVHALFGWTVRRRLQRGESGDWLLFDEEGRYLVLEVSGVSDRGEGRRRLKDKLLQVSRCVIPAFKAACVVEFAGPLLRLGEVGQS